MTAAVLAVIATAAWLAAEIAASRARRRPPEGLSDHLTRIERGLRR